MSRKSLWVAGVLACLGAVEVVTRFWWWKRGFEVGIEVFTMLGEWAVAYVIYHEIGNAREQLAEAEKNRKLTASLELLSEYSSSAMTSAMRSLFQWREHNSGDFAERFVRELDQSTEKAIELDNHRRFAYRYFHKIYVLLQAGLIDERVISLTLHNNRTCLRFLQDVLRPINEACGIKDDETFNFYRDRYGCIQEK